MKIKEQILFSRKFLFLGILLIINFSAFISAQETETSINRIYSENKESVFFVTQSIFLDRNSVKHVELFEQLEEAMDMPILDQYYPLVSGTAFLVNSDGHFITAAHVLEFIDPAERYNSASWSFEEYIAKYAIPGYISRGQLHTVFREYLDIIKSTEVVVTLKSIDKEEYVAEVIAKNVPLDLALLKIDLEEELTPLHVKEVLDLREGDSVYTIGYPLQFMMDSFLEEFKPTLTDGIISAIRSDNWDLQHTASINGGNSGGPLLNERGELIGVNVGQMTKANDIYFSINSTKIVKWLDDIDLGYILNQ